MPMSIACDANSIGIGAVIYYPDDKEKLIAYASKTSSNIKHNNADTLSRLPILVDQQVEQDCSLTLELDLIHSIKLE